MNKYCIFCGKSPDDKTKEHVIPRWLIEATGKPERTAIFGPNLRNKESPAFSFSFDQFTFPACKKCNEKSALLEEQARNVIINLLQGGDLSAIDFHLLLTWLDKVRIGLWHGQLFLQNNPLGIEPKYHIDNRVSVYDRFVIIYRSDRPREGINFIGFELPVFHYMPSCFCLFINNYCLFNASMMSLCSARLGFPFTTDHIPIENLRIKATPHPGFQRVKYPIVRRSFYPKGTLIAQPMFREMLSVPQLSPIIDTPYVRANSVDYSVGAGSVFYEHCGKTSKYPETPCNNWIPEQGLTYDILLPAMARQTYDYQLELMRDSFIGGEKTPQYKCSKKISDLWKNAHLKQMEKHFS